MLAARRKSFSIGCGILLLTAVLLYALPQLDYLRESVQWWCFPAVLLSYFFLLTAFAAPRTCYVALSLVFFCFVGSLLGFTLIERSEGESGKLVFWRLEQDSENLQRRDLLRKYRRMAASEAFPSVAERASVISREQRGSQEAKGSHLASISGEQGWLTAAFPLRSTATASNHSRLSLGILPGRLSFAGRPTEATAEFLGWLGVVLEQLRHFQLDELQEKYSKDRQHSTESDSKLRDASAQILRLSGSWSTGAPSAFAHYLLGTLDCIESRAQPSPGRSFAMSLRHFRLAAGLVNANENPELHALIFNNAAVCSALFPWLPESASPEKQVLWFKKALSSAYLPGFEAPRLAMQNLTLLTAQNSAFNAQEN